MHMCDATGELERAVSAGFVLLPSAPPGVVELCGQVLRFDAHLGPDEIGRRVRGLLDPSLDPSPAQKNRGRSE